MYGPTNVDRKGNPCQQAGYTPIVLDKKAYKGYNCQQPGMALLMLTNKSISLLLQSCHNLFINNVSI